jgi:hypothetical protein
MENDTPKSTRTLSLNQLAHIHTEVIASCNELAEMVAMQGTSAGSGTSPGSISSPKSEPGFPSPMNKSGDS